MTDVRLTALNPVDSQVYPVACNTSGELIVEQVDPGPDLTVTGNLTVNGTATFDSTSTFDDTATFDDATFNGSGTFAGSVNLGLLRVVADGTTYPRILATPDGTFYSESSAAVYPWNLNPNGSASFKDGSSIFAGINGGSAVFYGGDSSTTSQSNAKFRLNSNGSASFSGAIDSFGLTPGYITATMPAGETPSSWGLWTGRNDAGTVTSQIFADGSVKYKQTVNSVVNEFNFTNNGSIGFLELRSGGFQKTFINSSSGDASFSGDITCSDNTKGLILKSPNGTSYRLSVANDGTLSTSQA